MLFVPLACLAVPEVCSCVVPPAAAAVRYYAAQSSVLPYVAELVLLVVLAPLRVSPVPSTAVERSVHMGRGRDSCAEVEVEGNDDHAQMVVEVAEEVLGTRDSCAIADPQGQSWGPDGSRCSC